MRDANPSVEIAQTAAEELVGEDTDSITKSKERVVGPDGPDAKQRCVQDGFERKGRQRRMSVNEVDRLADEQRPKIRQKEKKVGQRRRGRQNGHRQVVHLEQSPGEVPNAEMSRMRVRDDDDLRR